VDDIDRLALQAFINDTTRGGVRDAFVAGMEHARTRVSPQGEPVAWGVFAPNDGPVAVSTYRPVADLYAVEIDRHHPERGPFSVVPLYTTPRVEAPKVDPAVAFLDAMARAWVDDDTQEAHDKALLAARAYLDSRGAK
jgi:hypothetical protein